MKQIIISISVFAMLFIVGCGGGSSVWYANYNSLYGVNALSTDENISLHVGDEVVETVTRYDQNASLIEKAVGSDNHAYYSVGTNGDYGDTVLQINRTYFYAATDCNDSSGQEQRALSHIVEDDLQIKIINTASTAISTSDVNITLQSGGVGIDVDSATDACSIRVLPVNSLQGDTITVSFTGTSYSYQISAQASIDIVIYDIAAEKAAIIPLPRLTPDAL